MWFKGVLLKDMRFKTFLKTLKLKLMFYAVIPSKIQQLSKLAKLGSELWWLDCFPHLAVTMWSVSCLCWAAILLGITTAGQETYSLLGSCSHKLSRNTPQHSEELSPVLCKQKTLVEKFVLGHMYLEKSGWSSDNCLGLCPWPITSWNKLSSFSEDSWFPPLKYGENKNNVYSHDPTG